MIPAPRPVPRVSTTKSRRPRPAPWKYSPTAAQSASLPSSTGRSSRRRNKAARVRPLQGDVGGVQHLSAGDGPRQADAHALRVPGRRSGGGEHLRRQIRQVRRKGLRPPEVQGAARRRQKAARLVRQARLQVGAAHVDTDEESAHFCFRLPCSARRSTRWASSWAALKP